MSHRVWVRCLHCGSRNQSPTILEHQVNENITCPGCKAKWQESQIIALVTVQGHSPDHVIWLS